jgi:hypothetical protein
MVAGAEPSGGYGMAERLTPVADHRRVDRVLALATGDGGMSLVSLEQRIGLICVGIRHDSTAFRLSH